MSLFSSYIYAFPSVLVCYPDFVFCPRIYEFEQRYTTVAFIWHGFFLNFGPRCCSTLYLFKLSNFCIWASLVSLVWTKCTSGVLKTFLTCCLLLAIIRVFLCQLCSPIYLYYSPVMLCCHFNVIFNIAIKEGGLAYKTRFNPPFFPLKMSCTKSRIWPLLYYSSFLCVLHFNVVFPLCRLFSLIFECEFTLL